MVAIAMVGVTCKAALESMAKFAKGIAHVAIFKAKLVSTPMGKVVQVDALVVILKDN
jgi:hypothetical protein